MSEITFIAPEKNSDTTDLVFRCGGSWVANNANTIEMQISKLGAQVSSQKRVRFDLSAVDNLDAFGAYLLLGIKDRFGLEDNAVELVGQSDQHLELLKTVDKLPIRIPEVEPKPALILRPFIGIGQKIHENLKDSVDFLTVFGRMISVLAGVFTLKTPFRFTSFVNQLDVIVLRAVPIVVLITLVVGAIITQQSIMQLRNFGAAIFVVDLGAILMFREAGLLLAAIMIAGRSGSAITAEIGSMRMREELDALNVMGVDPYAALVLPRILALIIGMPILAFIGALSGLVGTAFVANFYGGIPLSAFVDRLQDVLNFRTLAVGLIKAPVMAFIIGLVAVSEGFKVEGSSESLGMRTTSSVVKSIFLVIVVDGLFAMFFAAIGF